MLIHFVFPHGKLYQRLLKLEQLLGGIPPVIEAQNRPGPKESQHSIAPEEWPTIVRRVNENHEPLRKVAGDYNVSYEAIRRVIRAARQTEQAG